MNYYIADTHFGHENVIKFCNRPFLSVEEMNEKLIENWNSKITNGDKVYILGDMFYRCDNVEEILVKLKGKKHLILGNHDTWLDKKELHKYFVSIDKYLEINDGKNLLILSHYPMLSFKRENRKNTFMIHGHIHNDTDIDFFPLLKSRVNVLNAGVEINNYMPVTLDELIENNEKFKNQCVSETITLNSLDCVAEHKITGEKYEFHIPEDLLGDDSCGVCIDGDIYAVLSRKEAIVFQESSESEYLFRLKREYETDIIKPVGIVSAKTKPDYILEITFSNGESYEALLENWINNRKDRYPNFDFNKTEIIGRSIHWKDTEIYFPVSAIKFSENRRIK